MHKGTEYRINWWSCLCKTQENVEKFLVYHVTKEEFDTCIIRSPHPKIIAPCNSPYRKLFFTLSFRSFSPMPGALEFLPGKDYYFISTSSRNDLHLRQRGMCLTNNMRMVIKVAPLEPVTQPPIHSAPGTFGLSNSIGESDSKQAEGKSRKKKKNKKNKKKRRRKNGLRSPEVEDASQPTLVDHTPSLVAKVQDMMKQEASVGASSQSSSATAIVLRSNLSPASLVVTILSVYFILRQH